MRTTIREVLTELCTLPHRGSTTYREREAAGIIERRLKEFGYDTEIQPFAAPSSYSWELIGITLLTAGGLLAAPRQPAAGAIACLLAVWAFVRHFNGQASWISRLIPKCSSQNILGRRRAPASTQVVYLMAHYDTTRASHLFHPALVPRFRLSFLVSAAVVIASPVAAFLGTSFGEAVGYRVAVVILALYVAGQLGFLLHRELFHRHVNGANDNGSGVTAVLAMARHFAEHPLARTDVRVVATGCEEVGMFGARRWLDRQPEGARDGAVVLNFDNVGAGRLHYCVGEGMLGFHPYDEGLVSLAGEVAAQDFPDARPLRYTRAYFDTLPLVQNRVRAMSFIGLDERGVIPHWHWYSDTLENIEWEALERAANFGAAIVTQLDRRNE